MSKRMEPPPGRLSLETIPLLEDPESAEAALYLDREGLKRLQSALARLASGEAGQVHLLSGRWGGEQLTEERWRGEGLITHHLRILLRPDGEFLREVRYAG